MKSNSVSSLTMTWKQIKCGQIKKRQNILLNLMSSPGAGKTTTLTKTIDAMKHDFRIGVMEADIDSAVDADMTRQGFWSWIPVM